MDADMPSGNSIGVLKQVKDHLPNVPHTTELFLSKRLPSPSVTSSTGGCNSATNIGRVSWCSPMPRKAISALFSWLPLKDIFRVGYVFSKDWLGIWKECPLVFHDVQLAPDTVKNDILSGEVIRYNVARNASHVLALHPGPIHLARFDFCTWRGSNVQLRLWLHMIISKEVHELCLIGRWPSQVLDTLPNNIIHLTSLRKLHLCMLSIPAIGFDDHRLFPSLVELKIYHCEFRPLDLCLVLKHCRNLACLDLGYITQEVLIIQSESLSFLTLWGCTIEGLCVRNCPKLVTFYQEAERFWDHISDIRFEKLPMLYKISILFLSQQTLQFNKQLLQVGMCDYPVFENVACLAIALQFADPYQFKIMSVMLRCFPNLEELLILRLDWRERSAISLDWKSIFFDTQCIRSSVKTVQLWSCNGDDVEQQLGHAIVANADEPEKLQILVKFASGM